MNKADLLNGIQGNNQGDCCHVVIGNTETDQRLEIEGTRVDGDGVINIITTGRSAGNIDPNVADEFIEEDGDD